MTNIRLSLQDIFVGQIAQTYTTPTISLDASIGFAFVIKKTDVVLVNATFASVSLNAITAVAHGYKTGLKVRFTTTVTLPTGLALVTDYFLIRVSADTLMVASTQQNAIDGVFLTISGGSGTHTIVVQAAALVYLYLEGTIDDSLWVKILNSTYEITSTAQLVEHETAFYKSVRAVVDLTSGQFDLNSKLMVKGF